MSMTAFQAAGKSASLFTRTKFHGIWGNLASPPASEAGVCEFKSRYPDHAPVPELVYGTVREAVFCGFESLQAYQAPVV